MPGPIKGLMFFQAALGSPRTVGWSESVYFPGVADLPTALTRLQILAAARVQMFGAGVLSTFLRVSDDTVFRDSADAAGLMPLNAPPAPPVYNLRLASFPADFAGSAYFLLCAGGNSTYRRIYWLSGNPDNSQEIGFST